MSLLWETSFTVFFFVTVLIGGGAAWMAGRGIALSWRPTFQIVIYMLLLALAVRFLHFSLFEGTLLTLHYYIVDLAVLLVASWLGYRYTRTNQMVQQYHWLYEKVSPLSWREKQS